MMTVAKTDKSRLTIRGLVDGDQYIVREQPDGWFITPEKKHRLKKTGMSADAFAKLYRSRSPYRQTETFLSERTVPMNYSATDLAADNATLDQFETRLVQAVGSLDAGRGVNGETVFSRLRKRIKKRRG